MTFNLAKLSTEITFKLPELSTMDFNLRSWNLYWVIFNLG